MSGATTTTLSWILKNVYSKMITDSLNREAWGWDKLPKAAPEKPTGNGIYFPIKFSGNQAVGPQNAGEALRAAQSPGGAQAVVQPKVYTGTIEMEGLTKAVTEGDQGSFVNGWDHLVTDVVDSLKKRLNWDWNHDGTGKISLLNGASSASTTITCDSVQGFQVNQLVDIYDATDTNRLYQARKINAIQLFSRTCTLDVAVTAEDNAVVYATGEKDSAASDGKGIGGLERMIDTTTVSATYLSVSRSTYPNHACEVIDASSANLSNDILQRLHNRIRIRGGRAVSKNMILLSHVQQLRKYLDLVTPSKRFNNLVLDSGFTTLEWNGKPWVFEDVDVPEDVVYMLDGDDLWKWEVQKLDFDESDGSMVKAIPGYDKIMAFVKYYGNVGIRSGIRHGKIKSLATPSI